MVDEEQVAEATAEAGDQETTDTAAAGSQQSSAAEPQAQDVDELTSLRQRVQELEERAHKESEQATDYMHRWQRVAADFANYKRRTEQERDDLVKFANQVLIGQLLTVLDNFERAFTSIPRELRSLSWISGVNLIYQQLFAVLMQQGLEAVTPGEGERYDPQLHEAISYEPADGKDDGMIVRVYQTGYRLHGRLVRPALVTVAQGGASAPPDSEPRAETPAARAETEEAADGEAPPDGKSPAGEPPA